MSLDLEKFLENALISKASYKELNKDMLPTDLFNELTKRNIFGKQDFTASEAKKILGLVEQINYDNGQVQYDFDNESGYKIIGTFDDQETGYYGIAFKNRETGEIVIANRGTEDTYDLLADAELVAKTVPEQFISMSTFMNELIEDGIITKSDYIIMTGHSLGGAESQMGTAAYPDYIDESHTQNAPGAKDLNINVAQTEDGKYHLYNTLSSGEILLDKEISKDVFDAYIRFNNNKDSEEVASKITNIHAKDGINSIHSLNEDIGKNIAISGDSHSILKVIDTLKIYNALHEEYLNNGDISSFDFLTWMDMQKDNISKLEGGYGDILDVKLENGNRIYLVKNENGNYDKYTLEPQVLNADGSVKEYGVKAYDENGNLEYSHDNKTFIELNSVDENGEQSVINLPIIDFDSETGSIEAEYNPDDYDTPDNDENSGLSAEEQSDNQAEENESQSGADYSAVLNTAINQVGSLIINNNQNFSNIEKVSISTTVATIADFSSYTKTTDFDVQKEGLDNLKGAVASFAVSTYFSKNDNISDILGMDGTFVGDFADFALTFTLGFSVTILATTQSLAGVFSAATIAGDSLASTITVPASFPVAFAGAAGAYLGSALANEIKTYKMHNGHRGINHPVINLKTGKGEITSQNHGFAIDRQQTENNKNIEITHLHLNDNTIAGIKLKDKNCFSVQFHPEASAGPHDSSYLFDEFVQMIKK